MLGGLASLPFWYTSAKASAKNSEALVAPYWVV